MIRFQNSAGMRKLKTKFFSSACPAVEYSFVHVSETLLNAYIHLSFATQIKTMLSAGFLFPGSTPEEDKRVCQGEKKIFCKDFVNNAEVMFLLATGASFLVVLSLVRKIMPSLVSVFNRLP